LLLSLQLKKESSYILLGGKMAEKKEKKKSRVPLYWITMGLLLLFFNNVVALLHNLFGLNDIGTNAVIFAIITILTYYFTPYIDAIVRGN
jgi:uncharacterized membrane protein